MNDNTEKLTDIEESTASSIKQLEEATAASIKMIQEAEARLQAKIEEAAAATKIAEEAKAAAEEASVSKPEQIVQLSPKDKATANGEPWVGVIETHVNPENIRNGFFELDWNQMFIDQLKLNGYGYNGDSDESVIDRWFKELCANVVMEGEYPSDIATGTLDVASVLKANS